MKNEPIHYSFILYAPDSLLVWLLIICFLGCLITGIAMIQVNAFITDKSGNKVSTLKLAGVSNRHKIVTFFSGISGKGLTTIRRGLMIDYAFMPFLYLLMAGISGWSLRHSEAMEGTWVKLLHLLFWVPFFTWLFDLIENTYLLFILSDYRNEHAQIKNNHIFIKSLSSVLKWVSGFSWLLLMISLLLDLLVNNLFH